MVESMGIATLICESFHLVITWFFSSLNKNYKL